MRCGTARTWLEMQRDVALPEPRSRALEAHLTGCSRCRTYGADLATLGGILAALPVEEPPANFEWKLKLRIAALEHDRGTVEWPVRAARRSWRAPFEFGGAVAVAATVVIAVGLASWRGSAPVLPPAVSIAPPPSPPSGGLVTELRGSAVRVGPVQPSPAEYLRGEAADSAAVDSLLRP